ncbi:hypothetical protein BN949_05509 [Agrobacterium tumefaciens]|nr:hypothetical protein BN949_05509 [Agrobacterium tumefaciens]
MQQAVELPQRVPGILRLEIVLGPEHALPAGLALTTGDGAERVETSGDRREETPFCLDVRRDHPKSRRLLLVGAMTAPETLDRHVGTPSGFQKVMQAQALIFSSEIRVVGSACPAGVAEDENAFLVVHEGASLIEIGAARPVLDGIARDGSAVLAANDATQAAGDLGNLTRTEVLDDLVEGRRDRRQAAQSFDQIVAAPFGLPADDRVAVRVMNGSGAEIALGVGKLLEQLHRE